MDPDGSNPSPLPTNIKGDGGPGLAWSPDGTQIAFNDPPGHIWVMDADGSNLRVLTPNRSDLSYRPPVWSPDGTKLAFSASIEPSVFNTDIYTMDVNGSNMTNVTNTPQLGEDIHDFSPDGSQMCLYRASDDYNTVRNWGIYVMNVDTSNLTRLTKRYEGTEGCAWSPDGTKIAYPANSGLLAQPGGIPKLNVYVMNADGSKKTNLTSNPEEDDLQATGSPEEDTYPEWSPDGTRIAFSSSRDGGYDYDIYTMDADGSDVTQVTNLPGNEFSPDWQPLTPKSRSLTVNPQDTGGPSLLLVASALLFSGGVIFHAGVKRSV